MKTQMEAQKDRVVRSLAGALLIIFLVVQKMCEIDLSFVLYFIGINLFQYGITGWCPFATYFKKIGWLQNN